MKCEDMCHPQTIPSEKLPRNSLVLLQRQDPVPTRLVHQGLLEHPVAPVPLPLLPQLPGSAARTITASSH